MDLIALNNIKNLNFAKNINYNNSASRLNFKGNSAADSFESSCDGEIIEEKKRVLRKIKDLEKLKAEFTITPGIVERYDDEIKEYYCYLRKLQNSSDVAFIYNPDDSPKSKLSKAQQCDYLLSVADLSQELNIPPLAIVKIANSGSIKFDEIKVPQGSITRSVYDRKFINLNDENNKKIIEFIKNKITTGNVKTCDEIARIFEISSMDVICEMIRNNQLKCFGVEDNYGINTASALIDLDEEENIVFLERYKEEYYKTHPQKSKFIGKKYIPASYLQKLGFGDAKTFRKLISQGFLKGTVEKIEDEGKVKFKTLIDSSIPDFENKMLRLRSLNQDLLTLKEMSEQTGLSQLKLKKALMNDEMEIIPEYIFDNDSKKIFFDRKNQKNVDFINKLLFEEELLNELSAQRKAERIKRLKGQGKWQSLRMSIAWRFCPNTKKIASNCAKNDGKLRALFIKEANDEELKPIEERTINSYRKHMWNLAGSEELSNAIRKADELLKLYKESGIDAIEDDEIKEIFKEYEMK